MFCMVKQTLIGLVHAGRLRAKPYVAGLLCGTLALWQEYMYMYMCKQTERGPQFEYWLGHCPI